MTTQPLTSAEDTLLTSIGQPRSMTRTDLPKLDALASAICEHAWSLVLITASLPTDFTRRSTFNAGELARLHAEHALEADAHILTPEAWAYLNAAVMSNMKERV